MLNNQYDNVSQDSFFYKDNNLKPLFDGSKPYIFTQVSPCIDFLDSIIQPGKIFVKLQAEKKLYKAYQIFFLMLTLFYFCAFFTVMLCINYRPFRNFIIRSPILYTVAWSAILPSMVAIHCYPTITRKYPYNYLIFCGTLYSKLYIIIYISVYYRFEKSQLYILQLFLFHLGLYYKFHSVMQYYYTILALHQKDSKDQSGIPNESGYESSFDKAEWAQIYVTPRPIVVPKQDNVDEKFSVQHSYRLEEEEQKEIQLAEDLKQDQHLLEKENIIESEKPMPPIIPIPLTPTNLKPIASKGNLSILESKPSARVESKPSARGFKSSSGLESKPSARSKKSSARQGNQKSSGRQSGLSEEEDDEEQNLSDLDDEDKIDPVEGDKIDPVDGDGDINDSQMQIDEFEGDYASVAQSTIVIFDLEDYVVSQDLIKPEQQLSFYANLLFVAGMSILIPTVTMIPLDENFKSKELLPLIFALFIYGCIVFIHIRFYQIEDRIYVFSHSWINSYYLSMTYWLVDLLCPVILYKANKKYLEKMKRQNTQRVTI